MSLLWIIFAGLLLVVWIGTAIDIRRRRLGVWAAAGWLLVALLIPFLGAIVYWALRKPDAADRERSYDAEQSLRAERRDRGVDSTGLGR
jgi:hypothetical protein